ncbi:MAG: hypothetical protein O7E57_09870 [Gammaproteobacteria bacterium]|nr:hypothetical protein [Gammaproteobacteria bacterium]
MFRKLIVIMVGLALPGGFVIAKGGGELVLRVATDGATFDATSAPGGGGAFYISGVICADGDIGDPCAPIGGFHCWGWLIGPDQLAAVVLQEYDLDGRGKIQVQGVEDEGPRAVTGGTGDFRKARGEATGFDLSDLFVGGEFIATFKLEGVKGKGKGKGKD